MAIDGYEPDRFIRQAIQSEQTGDLDFRLRSCGVYISTKLHYFEEALRKHRDAKSARKRAETSNNLERAGRELTFAIHSMKRRMEVEQKDGELFFVDDHVLPPHRFSCSLRFTVSYRWRKTTKDPWRHGSITFLHEVDTRPNYSTPAPNRKPSAAKLESDLQDRLYRTWGDLMKGALYFVRDYFREGGDGEEIPRTFEIMPDRQSGDLNNFSTRFWRPKT